MDTETKQNLKFKPKIYRNLNPAGHWHNVLFGLCEAADFIVRVISFGRYATNLTLEHSRVVTRKQIAKLKQNQKNEGKP